MNLRILVVDKDPKVRSELDKILTRAGYGAVTTGHVDEAVGLASRIPFAMALVEDETIEGDGNALVRLRDVQPACLRVLLAGGRDFQAVVAAVNRGEVVRVLRKPVDTAGVLRVVQEAFDSARRMAGMAAAQRAGIDRHELRALDACFDDDLLRLALQPIVSRDPGHPVVAYEALLRSFHPVLSSPLAVLKVAEQHRRVLDLGQRVFAMCAEAMDAIAPPVRLFINLHPEQLGDVDRFRRDLEPVAHHRDRITLEITERSRLQDIPGWEDTVGYLLQGGWAIAIDDLGSGYNSLTMLADLQPSYIKLDMQLVRNVHLEVRKQRLCQLMSTFAEATDCELIAEGVETVEEAEALVACGAHLLQGYFFGRPALLGDAPQQLAATG